MSLLSPSQGSGWAQGDPWHHWAQLRPDLIAFEEADGQRWTYQDLDAWAEHEATAWREAGLRAGARVGLVGPLDLRWWVQAWSLWRLGATLVPLNPRGTTAEWEALAAQASLEAVSAPAEAPWAACLSWPKARAWAPAPQPLGPISPPRPDWAGRWKLLMATSGTSGLPKLVQLSGEAAMASARAWCQALGNRPGEAWWLGLGGHHVGGLGVALRQALVGGTCLLGRPSFSAEAARAQWVRCAWVSAVPLQAAEVLEAPGPALPGALRRLIVGGQAVGPGLLGALGPWAVATYGLTEAASGLCLAAPGDPPGCVGNALPGVNLRVDAAPGEVGRIHVQGPSLMEGLLDQVGRVLPPKLGPEGDWDTGDLGWMDQEGRLWVQGRADRLIVTGGEKIHPGELEQALLSHPGVAEAVALGLPDRRFGEAPAIAWRPLQWPGPMQAELEDHLGARLARFKCPKHWRAFRTFPRLAGGKVDRQAVAARVAEEVCP
jgi:acyl-CoA synthetase (AMP-forming)/AMP-acid ligase II